MVRKDYEAVYEFLESLFRKDLEENSDLSGGVICGHPGIGAHSLIRLHVFMNFDALNREVALPLLLPRPQVV